MSKKYPECPLYNHDNCKDLHNQKLCAIVRKDKKCIKKNPIPEENATEMLNTRLPKNLIKRVKIFCDENEMNIQDFNELFSFAPTNLFGTETILH